MRVWFITTLLAVAGAAGADQSVDDDSDLGGFVQAEVAGVTIVFPTLKTAIAADLQGDLATVTVVQTFANPIDQPLNATYLFPLNQNAAVYEMQMRVGEEIVHAQIQRIEEARKTFEKAKRAGKSAALLTQHRPNMFTQDIANLMPGLPIEVTLRYVQTVEKVDGDYELVIPLIVGPRFQPANREADLPDFSLQPDDLAPLAPPQATRDTGGIAHWQMGDDEISGGATVTDSAVSFNQWELQALPDYPPVGELQVPDQIDAERVGLKIRISAGMPIVAIESTTHSIVEQDLSDNRQEMEIGLAANRTIDNRDFVLRYQLAANDNQAGLLSYGDERGGFLSLLLEPPQAPNAKQITPREMVFVLDVSGSMHGLPLETSKAFMRQALRNLRATDSFRIIRFSDAATEFSSRPLVATSANIRRGIAYADSLNSGGGTVMTSGITQALDVPVPPGSLRLVTFLTDGYIGNDYEILALLNDRIGDARLFAFGVGTSVNRFLLTEMGRVGRGFSRIMDPTEDRETVAYELAERLETPVLTDISIDWGDLNVAQVIPTRIPDLFAGQSLRIQARYDQPGDYVVTVNGLVNGRRASLPLSVQLEAANDNAHGAGENAEPAAGLATAREGEAVALVWARSMIKDTMRQFAAPERGKQTQGKDDLKDAVIALGLEYSLVTQWTAFVAVSEQVVNPTPEATKTLPVVVPQVAGVSANAYGAMSGGATPEPEAWLGLSVLATLTTLGWLRRRRRA